MKRYLSLSAVPTPQRSSGCSTFPLSRPQQLNTPTSTIRTVASHLSSFTDAIGPLMFNWHPALPNCLQPLVLSLAATDLPRPAIRGLTSDIAILLSFDFLRSTYMPPPMSRSKASEASLGRCCEPDAAPRSRSLIQRITQNWRTPSRPNITPDPKKTQFQPGVTGRQTMQI